MNKFLATTVLLLAVGEAQAHTHSGIDSLTHSLEHLAANYPAGLPYVSGIGLVFAAALALLVRYGRRPQ